MSSRWHPLWLDVLTFQWQVNCWRANLRHQRHVSRLRHSFPSPDWLSARFARRFFFFTLAYFFPPFSHSAEPGPRLLHMVLFVSWHFTKWNLEIWMNFDFSPHFWEWEDQSYFYIWIHFRIWAAEDCSQIKWPVSTLTVSPITRNIIQEKRNIIQVMTA